MEWSERMNAAIAYIEENLEGEIDFSEAARIACCSTFHFQRVFFAVNGLTPAEYARRRRLTLAARDLTFGNSKVIDVAVKYGYDSPNAFTRAFRNLHGVTPQAAREPGVTLTAFPRISFHIKLEGGNDMDYRVIERPAFDVVGRGREFTSANGQNFVEIPKFWQEYMKTDEFNTLMNLNQGKPGKVTGGDALGVCKGEKGVEEFIYAICVERPDDADIEGFDIYHVPASSWAVFDCTVDKIQEITRSVFNEWLPSTGYEMADIPDFEVYLPGDPNSQVMRCQIWVPIIKK